MKGNIEERACLLALYIIENKATVRAAAHKFGLSKSTVHTEITKQNALYGRWHNKRGQAVCLSSSFFCIFHHYRNN